MEFTLYYRGPLKANRGARDKHILRQHFHRQMRALWKQLPLSGFTRLWDPSGPHDDLQIGHQLGAYTFVPLVGDRVSLVAELEITMLRPQAPGAIIALGGDIDNRIKTLLDALRMPRDPKEIPKTTGPSPDEVPFFCLLEDDSLVTRLSVATDRLLEPVAGPSEVVLLIHVITKQLKVMIGTIGLA
jgi:hypothetical protein